MGDRLGAVLRLDDVEARDRQLLSVQLAQLDLILDDEDQRTVASGDLRPYV